MTPRTPSRTSKDPGGTAIASGPEGNAAGGPDTLPSPEEWIPAALACVPASAQRVLVLFARTPSDETASVASANAASSRVEWRPLSAGALDQQALQALPGASWDAIVLGPGLLEAGEAARELATARSALGPAGRLVVVSAGGEPASVIERSLLEIGCAIRQRRAIGGAEEWSDHEPSVFVAQSDGYTVRAARAGDEASILALFADSFHVERSLEHWLWKYRDNPYGNGRISLAFAPSGELVGQYCAYPVRLYRSGEETALVHQVGDTMTARGSRGVGRGPTSVYGRTARHFYAQFCAGRVAFNYGFNTGNIQQLSIRFVEAHKVAEVSRRELEAASVRPPRTLRRLLGVRVRRVSSPAELGTEVDELYRASRDHYGALVERDARYLRWRYLDRPDARYSLLLVERRRRLLGWGVFARRERELVFGDALFLREHGDAVRDLLYEAVREAGEPAIERVVAWFPPHPPWWNAELLKLGFESRPEPQELGLMVVPFLDRDAPRWVGRSWYYAYGDSDLF